MALGDDAVVVREFALHQFGDKFHVIKPEPRLVIGKLQLQGAFFVAEQTLQLQHRFARQDHLLARHFVVQGGGSKRQTMAIGGHQAQLFAIGHKQNAIEVVADVVHRHGK